MTKFLKFLLIGFVFGIILTKSQVISWYRIQEMFLFDSFHMYGVIGSAVVSGIIVIQLIKRIQLKDISGKMIIVSPKAGSYKRYIIGGIIFGFGWALTGACPGPIYTLIGAGYPAMVMVLLSATLGTLAYGMLKDRLPH